MSFGKRKDGQAYPKRKKSGTKKSGSTNAGGKQMKKHTHQWYDTYGNDQVCWVCEKHRKIPKKPKPNSNCAHCGHGIGKHNSTGTSCSVRGCPCGDYDN